MHSLIELDIISENKLISNTAFEISPLEEGIQYF